MSIDIGNKISRLNPKQREAVEKTEGPLLILAGAGSGKTLVITLRVAYLLYSGVQPKSVLAVTFTNKAANEMKERLSSMLRAQKGNIPIISTFHSLCLAILRKDIHLLGYRKNFIIYDTSEQLSLLRNILSDIRAYDRSFRPEAILEKISSQKNGFASSGKTDELEAFTGVVYPRYQEMLKVMNAVDFDDLLLLTIQLFREHPSVLQKYQDRFNYIMVDEYQDTNKVQYELIKMLAGQKKNLCVVGDDDQSIYSWRGANLYNILDFEKDFPDAAVVRLEQNYRSTGNILHAANRVIANNRKRMEKSLWTAGGKGPLVNVFRASDSEQEARWVADRIALIRYEKNSAYENFAVLYRANLFSRPFEAALRINRIPYTVVGGTSYFERKEVKDLAAYLKIIANPLDDLSLLRAANAPKRGLGPTTISRFADFEQKQSISLLEAFRKNSEVAGLGKMVVEAVNRFTELIDRYSGLFQRPGGMARALKDLTEEINYKNYIYELYKTPEAAIRRIENVDSFIQSLSHYEETNESPSLHGFLETLALTDLSYEKTEKTFGVTLTSFHSAKGLEFPVVFIVGLEEDILPHRKSIDTDGDLEEERRLFYVGITRAMKELYLTYTRHRIKYGKKLRSSPSRFLEEIPDDLLKKIDMNEEEDPEDNERDAKVCFSKIKEILK
ncbi:MAG: ATP-dependent DNA helicase Rep [Nitrospira bacterium HGW-Nitrospira-1]|nr:MAG: ATP-dependent DNA helicase Rep [Nitrospira bacterium HGW-Nitrospira-1]